MKPSFRITIHPRIAPYIYSAFLRRHHIYDLNFYIEFP